MAIRVQNIPRKSVGQDSICSTPHFGNPPWWNLHGQPLSQTLSKNLSLRGESPSQCCQEVKPLDIPLEDQSSHSTQSSSQSQHVVTAMGRTISQDQSVSSDSVQIESFGKHVEEQVKSPFLMSNLEFSVHPHPSQVEVIQSAAHLPYAYSDPYSGLYSAYGPQAMPQMMSLAPVRVALPLDLAQDSPIYVNAKQYHGIMRRRQKRAKLEAQNRLAKGRKPYLHESRHKHALNRVRGSGGRFLSTKKQNQSEPTSSIVSHSASVHSHQMRNIHEMEAEGSNANRQDDSTTPRSAATEYTHGDIIFQPQDNHRFLNVSSQMAVPTSGVGGFTYNGTPHGGSAVR